ncbi:hypothetical protein JXB11_00215 [Candidatus Woesearchaeota archaeon]|nr:hypothetical protein [Candidatus Woesearchaeota archaeon]
MKLPLYAILLTLLLPAASAEILLSSPQDNAVLGSQTVSFAFTVGEQTLNCTLLVNGDSLGTATAPINTPVTIPASLGEGTHEWRISCLTNTSQIFSPTRQLTIDLTAPEVALATSQVTFNTTVPKLIYYPDDASLERCSLLIKIGGHMTLVKTDLSPEAGAENSFEAELADSAYEWNVQCYDSFGRMGTSLFPKTFTVDTTPPTMSLISPTSVVTESSTSLIVLTSEKAECRYAASASPYSAMFPFTVTGETSHRQFLTELSDGSYTYYVICRDEFWNEMETEKITLNVHLLPTAEITLSDESPVKAGIINVTLETSKSMKLVPTLTYSLGDGKETAVALTGSGSIWEGSILIKEAGEETLGTFSFRGTDVYDYSGQTITKGKSFLVDTLNPIAPLELNADAKEDSIELNWYSIDDDIAHYNIYRSTKTPVNYLDLFSSSASSSFKDFSVDDKVTYYYRIAGSDMAGNLGPLSAEVHATAQLGEEAAKESKDAQEVATPLQPYLVVEVNDAIRQIENTELSVDGAQSGIESLSGDAKKVSDSLSVPENVKASKIRIGELKSQLENLKKNFMDEKELRDIVKAAVAEAKELEKKTVKEVKIEEKVENIHLVTKEQIIRALTQTADAIGISEDEISSYASKNEKEVQDMRITTDFYVARLVMIDTSYEEKSVLTHSFSYLGSDTVQDSLVIALIPKTVAASSSELNFISNKPEVIQNDPILKWGFLSLVAEPQSVSYYVNRRLSQDDLQGLELVPMLNVNRLSEAPVPTGFTVAEVTSSLNLWFVLLGVLLVSGLAGYYFFMTPKQKEKVADPVSEELLTALNGKLSALQFELDDKIYPLILSIRNSAIRKDDISGERLINSLIDIAAHYLAVGQPSKAHALYPTIQLIYQTLSKGQKKRIGGMCIELHKQIKQNVK